MEGEIPTLNEWFIQKTTSAFWIYHSSNVGAEFFSSRKNFYYTVGFSLFPLFNAQLIREDTADDLDLIYVNCKEENIMNEVAGIKIYCVKK